MVFRCSIYISSKACKWKKNLIKFHCLKLFLIDSLLVKNMLQASSQVLKAGRLRVSHTCILLYHTMSLILTTYCKNMIREVYWGENQRVSDKIKEKTIRHLPVLHCWEESWRQWRFRTSCAPLFYSKFSSSSTRVFLCLLLCLSDNT